MIDNVANQVVVDESIVPLDGSDTSSDDIQITKPFDTSKIRVETKNTQMDALIKRIRKNEIDMAPSFQRRAGIWNDVAQSRLIESMLIKIPLPAFYMDATDDDKWLVVDGLQRLTTVRRYVIDEEFALTGLEFLTDYNSKKFSELPRSFQRRIEETDIVIYQIQPGTPMEVKFDIFRRINTGGEPLSPQEIRHALNQGQVTGFIEELANSKAFKRATDDGISPKRMDDRECIVRFLAFSFFDPNTYKEDNFDQFLNKAMAYVNKMNEKTLKEYEDKFFMSMNVAYNIFGKNAFRKQYFDSSSRYPINKALFETWSVNLGNLTTVQQEKLINKKDVIQDSFKMLLGTNKQFELAVSQGTGSINRIQLRFSEIKKIILETIE